LLKQNVGGILIVNFSQEAKKLFSLGVCWMPSPCQLWVAFDVPKVSVHFVQRFEFQRCSTLIKNDSRIEDWTIPRWRQQGETTHGHTYSVAGAV